MIKKRFVTCSVIAVLMIISRLFIFSTILPQTVREIAALKSEISVKNAAGNDSSSSLNSLKFNNGTTLRIGFISTKTSTLNSLNFANERLPLHDENIRGKMKRSLRLHSFSNLQSNMLQKKAEAMFPVIEPILKQYGIPDDFKFIPLVESGFGEGKSSRGAYGPWQFMAGTARNYGLVVNKHHDDRLNLRKSTVAACKYLLGLHSEFKSWAMVAAAYNTGSPNLARLMRQQCQCNYFRIKMNSETGAYVYNLIAMKEIINDPKHYGYSYQKLPYNNTPDLTGQLLAFN